MNALHIMYYAKQRQNEHAIAAASGKIVFFPFCVL